jgi:DNA ligase (NAD+)
LTDLRSGSEQEIIFPTQCPVCNSPLFKPEGEAAWRCINVNCPAQTIEHIIHFASKDAMDIRNLGAANIRRFYELGLLKNILGIYTLDFEKIAILDKFGTKSIENLKAAIEASKGQALHRLIYGLGIRYVGETTAKTLANAVTHILDFRNWPEEKLCTLEDIGPKVAASVFQFFQSSGNIHLLEALEAAGVKVAHDERERQPAEGPFKGKTFLFTGTLSHFKRTDAETMVEEKGGKILSGVSSRLSYLVVGADAGSKLEKARKLGTVKVLDEQAFLELMKS